MKKSKYLDKNFKDIVFSHDMENLKKVFEKCEINAIVKDSENMNALSFPGLNEEQIQYLVDNGIDVNGDCGKGLSAVAYQAYSVKNLKCLIKNGADINLKLSPYPGSAIEYAENHHWIGNIANLIECGADAKKINLEDCIYYATNINLVSLVIITKYMLNKGVVITNRMREYIHQIGVRFEYFRNDISKDFLDENSNALEELYKIYNVAPVPRRVIYDGKSDIIVKSTTWQKQHEELWDLLVPSKGHANTVQGEVIRIIGKVLYEILDNGGINWDNEFKKLVLAIPKYLKQADGFDEKLTEEAISLAKGISYDSDEKDLVRLNELVVKWVIANPKPIKIDKVEYKR